MFTYRSRTTVLVVFASSLLTAAAVQSAPSLPDGETALAADMMPARAAVGAAPSVLGERLINRPVSTGGDRGLFETAGQRSRRDYPTRGCGRSRCPDIDPYYLVL